MAAGRAAAPPALGWTEASGTKAGSCRPVSKVRRRGHSSSIGSMDVAPLADADFDPDVTAWLSQLPTDATANEQLFTLFYQRLQHARNHPRREAEGTHCRPRRCRTKPGSGWPRSRAHAVAQPCVLPGGGLDDDAAHPVNHELARRADKRSAELESLTISAWTSWPCRLTAM